MSALEKGTPESHLGREQLWRRKSENTLESLARTYDNQAKAVLSGKDGIVARDEISRFAKKISSGLETERDEYLHMLDNALRLRRPSFFDDIPDDEYERAAFTFALVKQYERSLQ